MTKSRNTRERQQWLQKRLAKGQEISTVEAAERFGVSQMTIRRDLKKLQDEGRIIRQYGGAVASRRITFEFEFDESRRRFLDEKRRIGRAAADRVEKGQTVFLDTGTTTLEIADALAQRALSCVVITSSLVIASRLWTCEPIELVLVGGKVRGRSPDLAGPGAQWALERLSGDIAFTGCDGFDPERGAFAGDMETARIAELMARAAARRIVVTDHSKLGRPGSALYLKTKDMDELITDHKANARMIKAIRSRGIKVTLV